MQVDKSNIDIVCDLDLSRYLGKWYEVAKFATKEQRNLDNVTAIYTLKDNGKVMVENAGYKKEKKRQIKGSAWKRDKDCNGALYVRFFWPFKSEYNVIKLAEDYRYSVVMGKEKNSLWILSWTPAIKDNDYQEIIYFLESKDFNVKKILMTKQDGCV